ncbi:putative transposase orfA for insertion sequence element [Methanocella paludicola SANAE]|uniref:Putative transposase orfA for insertion sequence element n=1 Tax=Methanocella paludicola (strain DSM 17711 / JCM 13418 / NBRC 101707 / SANAE) TaxID=304371 RepID=D1YV09_METPS|nr:putative transposase orfA for insertion sequence element [Methanocella paludicola SANAE]BAI61996.1 putative transposase orfA for insertion sequence element [Methanocella paludicola SANAE]
MGRVERRRFSREFKLQVLRELKGGKSVAEVCREYDLTRFLVARWKREHEENPDAFQGKGKARVDENRTRELERLVGQLYAENDFLKRALANMKKREEDRGRDRI